MLAAGGPLHSVHDNSTPPSTLTPAPKRKRATTGPRSDHVTWRRSPKENGESRVSDIEDLLKEPSSTPSSQEEVHAPPPSTAKGPSLLGSWLLPEGGVSTAPPRQYGGASAQETASSEDGLLSLLNRLEDEPSVMGMGAATDEDEIELACLRAEQEVQRRQFLAAARDVALDQGERIGWIPAVAASCLPAGLMWQRYKVMELTRTQDALVLILAPRPAATDAEKRVRCEARLLGSWTATRVEQNDIVNIVWSHGPPPDPLHAVVSDAVNFVIVRPDLLMSPTRVADANSCLRKSVIQDTATQSAPSQATVMGNLKHQIFQLALSHEGGFALDALHRFKDEVLAKASNTEAMFGVELEADVVSAELHECADHLHQWGFTFVGSAAEGAHVYFGSELFHVRVVQVVSTEEMIWSPVWGLKGALDATVVLELSPVSGSSTSAAPRQRLIAPLEFKTSASTRVEHMAQVILYALLVSDRYHGRPAVGLHNNAAGDSGSARSHAGVLVHQSAGKDAAPRTTGVKLAHDEVRHLLLLRNSFAVVKVDEAATRRDALVAPVMLPPVTGNVSGDCARCFVRDACVVHHVAVEQGTQASCGLSDDDFAASLRGVQPAHLAYFVRWLRMLDCEERCKVTHQRELWTLSAHDREDLGRCVGSLALVRHDELEQQQHGGSSGDGTVVLAREAVIRVHELQMQVGDRVLLSVDGQHVALAQGTLVGLSARSLRVSARLPDVHVAPGAQWRVDRLELLWGMRLLKSNLAQLVLAKGPGAHPQRLRALVVDLARPRFWDDGDAAQSIRQCPSDLLGGLLSSCGSPEEVRHGIVRAAAATERRVVSSHDGPGDNGGITQAFLALTEDQQCAVAHVLAARDWSCVVGVPGAGKTTTIAFVVRALHHLGRSVLITAYTHAALDNMLLKLTEAGLPVLRLGHAASVHSGLRACTLSEGCTVRELEQYAADESLIAGATCLGMASHPLLRRRRFAYCIVDEAGQITHPIALGVMHMADVSVLVGDQNQLPPLVVSDEARAMGMGTSLFEDLSKAHPAAVVTLCTQFRMNAQLNELANQLIYGDQLRCGSPAVANRRLHVPRFPGDLPMDSWLARACDPACSVVFLDTDGCLPGGGAKESREGAASSLSSQDAPDHAQAVVNEVEALIAHVVVDRLGRFGVAMGDVGVISPYRAQLRLLRRRIVDAVEVQTVDTFQGRDKACIVVSLVRSNAEHNVGALLQDWRRINVAFTRAKSKLVVIGSRATLRQSGMCAKFVHVCASKGWICTLPPNGHVMFGDPARRAGF